MAVLDKLKIGVIVNLDVYAPQVFTESFDGVEVLGTFDALSAIALGLDVVPTHNLVYPTLPVNTPKDALELTYVKLKLSTGKTVILATEWIIETSIVPTGANTLIVTFDNVTASDVEVIITTLTSNGYRFSTKIE